MSVLDALRAPWAIAPERLLEIQAIYRAHRKGEKADLDALEARLGRVLANEQKACEIRNWCAVRQKMAWCWTRLQALAPRAWPPCSLSAWSARPLTAQ